MNALALSLLGQHRRAPAQALFMLAGLALGIAVVVAIDLGIGSARAAFANSRAVLTGDATHRIVGTGGARVPSSLLHTLRVELGIRRAAPVVESRALHAASGQRLQVLAVDPLSEARLRPWLGAAFGAGSAPGRAGEGGQGTVGLAGLLGREDVAVIAPSAAARIGVAAGERLTVLVEGRRLAFRIGAVAHGLPAGSGELLLLDLAAAPRLGASGSYTHIDLVLEDSATVDAVAAALPPALALQATAAEDAELAAMSAAFEVNLQALSLLALLVGSFVVFQTLSLLTLRRRGMLGLWRALGVGQAQLRRLLVGEALLLGAVAAVLGAGLGWLLAGALLDPLERTYSDLFRPASIERLALSPLTLLKALLLAEGGALLAVLLPVRDALRVPPSTELRRLSREEQVQRRTRVAVPVALVLLLVAALLLRLAPPRLDLAFVGIFLALAASLGLVPWLAMQLLRVAARIAGPHARALPLWLLESARRGLGRTGIALAALTLAVATLVGMSTMMHSFRAAVGAWIDRSLQADVFVTPGGGRSTVPPALIDALAAGEHVEALSLTRARTVAAPQGRIRVIGVALPRRGFDGYEVLQGPGDTDALWQRFGAGEALASEPLAARLALSVGDRLTLPSLDGPVPVRIAAIHRDYSSPQGTLVLALGHYRALFGDHGVGAVGVYAAPGTVGQVAGALERRLAARADVDVTTSAEIRRRTLQVFDRTFAVTDVLRLLVGLIAAVAVLGALSALQIDRAREYTLLRSLGVGKRMLRALQLVQAGTLGLLAGVLALPFGIALAVLLIDVVNRRAFGWSMALAVPWDQLGAAFVLALGSAIAAGLLPAWWLARQPLARQLRLRPL